MLYNDTIFIFIHVLLCFIFFNVKILVKDSCEIDS